MDWMEQIKAAWHWVPKDPGTVLDGWGLAVLVPLVGWLIACFRKPKDASIQHDASEWLAKNRRKLRRRFQEELRIRLHSFLFEKEPLELDKILAPQEVAHPHSLLELDGLAVETTDQPIAALFNRPEVGRRLAILGEPGSGKTVCLLKLCGHLLQEAEADESAPLPVIFECSEWDSRDLPDWMAWQLHRKHHFPEDKARQLVQTGDIFPLFDGLDELAAERQRDFVRAFNAFAEGRHLVLCCRLEEYRQLWESAGQKLTLSNAAILQDIAPARLKGHLQRQGLDALWNQIEQSESLLQLARRPLFLGLMMLQASQNRSIVLPQGENWEDFLWQGYLQDCLKDDSQSDRNKSPDLYSKKYKEEQSLHWLRCLAKWMQAEQKVELQIDELQPSMLKEYWRFAIFDKLVVSLMMTSGLLSIFFVANPMLLKAWSFVLPYSLLFALLFILPVNMLLYKNSGKRIYQLRPLNLPTSWKGVEGMIAGLNIGLHSGLVNGLSSWLFFAIIFGQSIGLISGIFFGLSYWMIIGLTAGLRMIDAPIKKTTKPQDRLKEGLLNSLLICIILVLICIILFLKVIELPGISSHADAHILFNMQFFCMFIFLISMPVFLSLDIYNIFQYYLLRFCLYLEGQLPLHLVSWLAAMQQRKVLQRVGGSYHFLHKQLQEYLAKQIGVAGMLRRTGKTVSLEEMEEAIRQGAQERK